MHALQQEAEDWASFGARRYHTWAETGKVPVGVRLPGLPSALRLVSRCCLGLGAVGLTKQLAGALIQRLVRLGHLAVRLAVVLRLVVVLRVLRPATPPRIVT